jgi:hypothetical protein
MGMAFIIHAEHLFGSGAPADEKTFCWMEFCRCKMIFLGCRGGGQICGDHGGKGSVSVVAMETLVFKQRPVYSLNK